MSISSSIGGNPLPFAAGETLGPAFGKLAAGLDDATRGLKGFTPALTNVTGALKGLAAAASPNGMKPLNQAFDLLAASVGRVVLPGVIILAAEVASVATEIAEELQPAMEGIAQWYANNYDTFVKFGQAIKDVTQWAVDLAHTGDLESKQHAVERGMDSPANLGDLTATWGLGRWMAEIGNEANRKHDLDQQILKGNIARDFGAPNDAALAMRAKGEQPQAVAADPLDHWNHADDIDPDFIKGQQARRRRERAAGFRDAMVNEMQMSMGGAPGFSRIEDAWRKNQMATFESPMEAILRKFHQDAIAEARRTNELLKQGNAAPNMVGGGKMAAGR